MGTRERPADRGRRRALAAVRRLGEEHRRSRVGSGLSLRVVAKAAGTSHTQVHRFELGKLMSLDLADVGAWCAVVGLELQLRAFPAGDSIRDAGQQRLLGRLHDRLAARLSWRTEVPLGIDGDLRAWDAVIGAVDWSVAVEAETVLDDLQAVERRIALKASDGRAAHMLLLAADTRRNRTALAGAPNAFGGFDRSARGILRRLGQGTDPPPRRSLLLL